MIKTTKSAAARSENYPAMRLRRGHTVTVRQDEHKPVPVEVLAQSIKDISAGIRKLREGPLNEKALLLLIQHATPYKGYSGRIGIGEIKNVLDGMESLERTYLKPKAKA